MKMGTFGGDSRMVQFASHRLAGPA